MKRKLQGLFVFLMLLVAFEGEICEAACETVVNGNDAKECMEISTVEEWISIEKSESKLAYKLTNDIDVGETLLVISEKQDITIDLNGYTIEGNSSMISNYGNLKIINSSDKEGKVVIQCDKTVESETDIVAFENFENAKICLQNFCIEMDIKLNREIEKTNSAEYHIGGVLNYGISSINGCKFVLSGVGKTDSGNANLRIYAIRNNDELNVQNSKIEIDGKVFSEDSLQGYYSSCLLWGVYNESEKEVVITNSDILIDHRITLSEGPRDWSCAVYNSGSGDVVLNSVNITCKLLDCVEEIDCHIYGIENRGTGNFYISGGKIDVSTQGVSDKNKEVYGIYNQGGSLELGTEALTTEINVIVTEGSAWGIYDSSRTPALIQVKDVKISAESKSQKGVRGFEISSNSVAEVKFGNPEQMSDPYPVIAGTEYAVLLGRYDQSNCIYSGTYGSKSDNQLMGVDAPENSLKIIEEKDGISYVRFAPKPYSKWVKDEKGWWYLKADGTYPYNCWQNIGSYWYYFDAEGYMKTGWLYDEEQWYYLGSDGSMAMGWRIINNIWYFFLPNGAMASERWIGEYYVNETGAWVEEPIHFSELTIDLTEEEYLYDGIEKRPQVIVKDADEKNLVEGTDYIVSCKEKCIGLGQYKIEIRFKGKYIGSRDLFLRIKTNPAYGIWMKDRIGWWYRKANGSYPRNGWEKIDGVWYYFDQKGYRMTGWIMTGGKWYYLQEKGNREETAHLDNPYEGVMLCNAWFADKDGQLYYLQSDGSMKIGWLYQNQKWYYLKANGSMAKDQWIDGYYVDKDGVWQQSY